MVMSTDALLDRMKLRRRIRLWRIIAITVGAFAIFSAVSKNVALTDIGQDYIARISVENIIDIDRERNEILDEIAKNKKIRAVIMHINSPGGTAAGGETLYLALKDLNAKKPVIAIMNNMATSAAYMIALPTERIFAQRSSLTGSIGVIMQTPNLKGLAEKIGVDVQTVRTGSMKGEPMMLEEMTPETRTVMQDLLNDFYEVFVEMVAEHRPLTADEVRPLADGRVYSGKQAFSLKLIDALGGEKEARKWLSSNKSISGTLEIKNVKLHRPKSPFKELMHTLSDSNALIPKVFSTQGLLSVWQNNGIN